MAPTIAAMKEFKSDIETGAYPEKSHMVPIKDVGVPVEMIVYKGYGHGITKPKSVRAVMQHNLAWFNHYIFGDPKPNANIAEHFARQAEARGPRARGTAARP